MGRKATSPSSSGAIDDGIFAKALGHPLRIEILHALEGGIASPSELAGRLDAPIPTVSYHVKVLADLGMLKLVKKTPRRGAIEHHYRLEERPELGANEWDALPGILKRRAYRDELMEIADAVASADLKHPESRVVCLSAPLDRRGREEFAVEVDRLQRKFEQIAARSQKRSQPDSELTTGAALVLARPE
jgi:DNA-binding transcriptional ArsR family regulator